jgi:hypothetical protein
MSVPLHPACFLNLFCVVLSREATGRVLDNADSYQIPVRNCRFRHVNSQLKHARWRNPWRLNNTNENKGESYKRRDINPVFPPSLRGTRNSKQKAVFWVVALCGLVEVYRRFKGARKCLWNVVQLLQGHPEDRYLHICRCENLKSYDEQHI